MSYALGIDFGTSTTKVTLRRGKGVPQEIVIGKAEKYMPSVVSYKVNSSSGSLEKVAVGESADNEDREDVVVIREIKRVFAYEELARMLPIERYPWWNSETKRVQIGQWQIKPHDVVLEILREALDRALRWAYENGVTDIGEFDIKGIPTQLGCSATANLEVRRTLSEIACSLGFRNFKIGDVSEEPILASLSLINPQATTEEIRPGQIVLVYDFGGGTFDTAVVRVEGVDDDGYPILTIFAADGEPLCGGADIDEAVFDHMMDQLAMITGETATAIRANLNQSQVQQLRNLARQLKEELSQVNEVQVSWPLAFPDRYKIDLNIKRSVLADIIRQKGLVETTLDCVLRTWRRARMFIRKLGEDIGSFYLMRDSATGAVSGPVLKLGHKDLTAMVDKILVVGGTTHMPVVWDRLKECWGESKLISHTIVDPVLACATGAAWQAGRKRKTFKAIVDRLPYSITLRPERATSVIACKAFDKTVSFYPVKGKISPFRAGPFHLGSSSRKVIVDYVAPDGKIIKSLPFDNVAPIKYL
jgi:molecular chaperone DnaK (HSP70)